MIKAMEKTIQELVEFSQKIPNFDDERSFMLQLSAGWRITLGFVLISSLFIGWISNIFIFSHIFKTKIKVCLITLSPH